MTLPHPQAATAASTLPSPYLLFVGDTTEPSFAKTAFGLRDWAPERCLAEFALADATVTTGLPRLTLQEAHAKGARALVIGVANAGGYIPASWLPALEQALAHGLDIISGMHIQLETIPALREAARRHGRALHNVRVPPSGIPIATGRKRSGRRLLTVGTDCALGKKYTALALSRAFASRGISTSFRATGQTGILISGGGIPMDAVIADFEAGAAEMLSPDAAADHWDVIEGQGSLFHPSFAAVSLGLLHGSQPDVIVVCHQPGRATVSGLPGYALPSLMETIDLNLRLGRRTNLAIRCAGISLNTAHLSSVEREALCEATTRELGVPTADPMCPGKEFDRLVDSCLYAPM